MSGDCENFCVGGIVECWSPGGPCAVPNEPGCETCGPCNACTPAEPARESDGAGLRGRLTALADEMEQAGVFSDVAWPSGWAAKVRALALLADPAPEAARNHATGTTTDWTADPSLSAAEKRARFAALNPQPTRGPAPAPVVSAGDEGVGLREDEREALRFELERPVSQRLPQVVAAVERILAARVAEAGARAWEHGRWWRVLDADGGLWCETSDEDQAREALTEVAGGWLERQWRTVEQTRWDQTQ